MSDSSALLSGEPPMDGLLSFHAFLAAHQSQLESSAVPKIFWESLWRKLKNETFDAGLFFQLASVDYGDSVRGPTDPVWKLFATSAISPQDPQNVFLVDHAWSFDASSARRNLSEVPGLLDRMSSLMGVDVATPEVDRVDVVLAEMWRHNRSFALSAGSVEDRMPVWYVMDELGSAINHSDEPNFRAVPFLHLREGATYTLLFPVRRVDGGEEITRDFVEGQTSDPEKRRALLLPWRDSDFSHESFAQTEPEESYFLAGHVRETLPPENAADFLPSACGGREKIRVYSEYSFVNEYLTDSRFEIVEDENEADVLWLLRHFKDYENLGEKFVNQFPFENVFTIKDLLAIVCRRAAGKEGGCDEETLETRPDWLPTTYNLSTELVQFVAYFRRREARGLDNHWICKPWNLARGLDTHVTRNLNHILRLPSTGPKIAQKYIERPVLFQRPEIGGVKFDVRYVILLRSVAPLRAFAYANFFLRFANREFALNNLDDYEQHFTVMNYAANERLCHLRCADFVDQWNAMYPDFPWAARVEPRILRMLREIFEAAAAAPPPRGVARSPQSRAVYAADLMLRWKDGDMQPAILEINFSPDNKRACEYYPEFYNDIFKCLFLDETNPDVFHDLCVGD